MVKVKGDVGSSISMDQLVTSFSLLILVVNMEASLKPCIDEFVLVMINDHVLRLLIMQPARFSSHSYDRVNHLVKQNALCLYLRDLIYVIIVLIKLGRCHD